MKAPIILLFAVLITFPTYAQEPHQYTAVDNIYYTGLKQINGTGESNWGAVHSFGTHLFNYQLWDVRCICGWNWTNNDIPTQATLTSVRMKMLIADGPDDHALQFTVHNIPHDLLVIGDGFNFYSACVSSNVVLQKTMQVSERNSQGNYVIDEVVTSSNYPNLFAAFSNAISSGNYYLTLGFKQSGDQVPPFCNIISSNPGGKIELTFNFTTPTQVYTLQNVINGTTDYGSLIVDGDADHPTASGDSKVFTWRTSHTVITNELPFIPNWNNTNSTQKFLQWDVATETEKRLSYSFIADIGSPNLYSALFDATSPALLTTKIIEASSSAAGAMSFTDPWYYYGETNHWHQANFTTSFNTPAQITNNSANSYGGVFLSRSGSSNNWPAPCYQISAPSSQSIGGIAGCFQYWSTTNGNAEFQNAGSTTTLVDFKQTNTTVVANYKGHLFSNSSNATANNNQRKIAQTLDGTYFMVYESVNKVWMTKSTNGVDWGNEIEVSSESIYSINKSPSIFASENGNIVAIVWQGINETSGGFDGSNIYYRIYASGSLQSTEAMPGFTPSSNGFEASPVVTGRDLYDDGSGTTVVWREPTGLAVRTKQEGSWSEIAYIPNTNGNCLWPSVTRRASDLYAICWQNSDADRIDFIETSYGDGMRQFINAAQVSPYGWGSNQKPSIAVNGDKTIIVTWQSVDNVSEGIAVHIRECPQNQLWSSTITSFSMSSPSSAYPVIGTYLDLSSYYVLWENEGNIYSTRGLNSTWTTPSIIGSGSSGGTNISAVNRTRSSLVSLWKKSNGQITLSNSGLQKTGNAGKLVSYRLNKHIITYLDSIPSLREKGYKGMIAFEVAGLSKQSSAGNRGSLELGKMGVDMRSEKFAVNASDDVLNIAGAYYAKGVELPKSADFKEIDHLVKLRIKDASTDEIVKEIWNVPLSHLSSATTTDGEFRSLNIPLTGIKDREVYVDIEMAGTSNPLFVNDYYILDNEGAELKDFNKYQQSLPTVYALHQNYPNPFNPSTTIQFDLTAPQHVSLKVYNMLGQEVKELVNDDYEAGYHNIQFNASSLSSGVYVYRIVAGQYVETKRLVLLK